MTSGQRISRDPGSPTPQGVTSKHNKRSELYGGEKNEVHGDSKDTGDHEVVGTRAIPTGDRGGSELREIDGERSATPLPGIRADIRGGNRNEQRSDPSPVVSCEGRTSRGRRPRLGSVRKMAEKWEEVILW